MESTTLPNDAITKEAADAVVEFALIAFEPEYCCWSAQTNAALAAFAWNTLDPETRILARGHHFPDPRMEELYERLERVRRSRFGDCRFTVWDLEPSVEDGEVVFSFRLSWDGGDTARPCRIVVDHSVWCADPLPSWN